MLATGTKYTISSSSPFAGRLWPIENEAVFTIKIYCKIMTVFWVFANCFAGQILSVTWANVFCMLVVVGEGVAKRTQHSEILEKFLPRSNFSQHLPTKCWLNQQDGQIFASHKCCPIMDEILATFDSDYGWEILPCQKMSRLKNFSWIGVGESLKTTSLSQIFGSYKKKQRNLTNYCIFLFSLVAAS